MTEDNDKKKNKKIGIITFHRANNYGAVLQAYALSNYLDRSTSMDCEIINYISDYMERQYRPFIVSTKSIKSFVLSVLYCPIRIMRGKSYKKFRKNYYKISDVSYSKQNIEKSNDKYDCFVFGSDQIWNNELNGEDGVFYGNFVNDGKDKISYATSFGDRLFDKKKYEEYVEDLRKFKRVSLREKAGTKIYKDLTGKDAKEVVDPVFLLDKNQWELLCGKKVFDYILIYHLQGEKTQVAKCARELSKKTGLPIVEMQVWIKKRVKNTKYRHADSPNEFLTWIKNAKYVITDSFHCTAFSIIFEKNFWACLPNDKKVEDTRVGNLLLNLGLVGRQTKERINDFLLEYDLPINYSLVNSKKEELISYSKKYLCDSLDK